MCDINSMNRGNALAQTRRNSLSFTVIRLPDDERVGCMQWLGSRAFEPAKRSGSRHNLYPKNLIRFESS